MEPSYEATLGYGFAGVLPGVILADALASADRNQEALALVTGLLEKSSTPERGPFISELWRIRGEMVRRQSADDSQEAERYFGTALRIADKQPRNVGGSLKPGNGIVETALRGWGRSDRSDQSNPVRGRSWAR
jgi:hypothetical protein